ncbi:MAG: peptidoglycan editing factor PgeF [Bacillota bacterium]|nr:peptidoglycan editing factor PgeF [Bacillota bacterium]
MDILRSDGLEYIGYRNGRAVAAFFTANNDLDFFIQGANFQENIDRVKEVFKLKAVGYGRQIHSDIINVFDGTVIDGDALVTDKTGTAVGIFTADCVPLLLYDKGKDVCAAVHSGWKGTYVRITSKTITLMKERFGSKPEDITVFIGPHIGACCYEVGQDLIDLFRSDSLYMGYPINSERQLDLEMCIRVQCLHEGIREENINSTGLCTYCSGDKEEIRFHSYRREREKSGRMFSLVYIEE